MIGLRRILKRILSCKTFGANTMKLASKLKEAQIECGRLKMKEAKMVGLKERLSTLKSKCLSLESEKTRLVEQEAKLQQEAIDLSLRCKDLQIDRAEVVSKVVPYIAMKLYHSDEVGKVIANLVNAAIYHGKCTTLEEIAKTGEPVILYKVPYYRPTHEREYDDASNAFASAEYPFLIEATKYPMVSVEDHLSKKRSRIQPSSPSRRTSLMKPSSLLRQEDPTSSKNA